MKQVRINYNGIIYLGVKHRDKLVNISETPKGFIIEFVDNKEDSVIENKTNTNTSEVKDKELLTTILKSKKPSRKVEVDNSENIEFNPDDLLLSNQLEDKSLELKDKISKVAKSNKVTLWG